VNADVFVTAVLVALAALLALATLALVLAGCRRVPSVADEAREEGDAALR